MKISIAMCTYNGAAFLSAQLQSIMAQTRPPDEIVLVAWQGDVDTQRTAAELVDTAKARKLGTVLHRMWVDGSTFRWSKEAPAAA